MFRRKKLVGVVGIAVLAMALSAGVFAYYAGIGSGSGQATAGHSPISGVTVEADVTMTGDDTEAALYPGDTSDITVMVSASSSWPAARRARIGSANVTVDSGSLPAGCLSSWFTFTPNAFTPGFVTGTTPLEIVAGSLTFNDLNVDQSACSDAVLTLNATVGA